MADDSPAPQPPAGRPDTPKPPAQVPEPRATAVPKPGPATERTAAAGETGKSQADEVSKARALVNGVADAAGRVADAAKALAAGVVAKGKDHAAVAGDVGRRAVAMGAVTGAVLINSPVGVEAANYIDQAAGDAPSGHNLVDRSLSNTDGHAGTVTTPDGQTVRYAVARPAEAPALAEPGEGPAEKFVDDVDEFEEALVEGSEERAEHPVIEGEFDD